MYCSPNQDQFISDVKTNFSILGDEAEKVQSFTAHFPKENRHIQISLPFLIGERLYYCYALKKEYTDAIYDSCKIVKQIWFSELDDFELIPEITMNIIDNRFCADVDECNGVTWLTAQGTLLVGPYAQHTFCQNLL